MLPARGCSQQKARRPSLQGLGPPCSLLFQPADSTHPSKPGSHGPFSRKPSRYPHPSTLLQGEATAGQLEPALRLHSKGIKRRWCKAHTLRMWVCPLVQVRKVTLNPIFSPRTSGLEANRGSSPAMRGGEDSGTAGRPVWPLEGGGQG